MQFNISKGVILGILGVLAIAGVIGWYGMSGGGHKELAGFPAELARFSLQAISMALVSLVVVYVTQLVRNMRWFDSKGAARELSKVRDRIDTEDECSNDAIAAAIQYTGTTILIAAVILAFFLMHSG